MAAKKQSCANLKAIRWDLEDWQLLATIAKRVGLTRSAFVKQAAMREAGMVLAGAAPHYREGTPGAIPDNGGANTFSEAKLRQKRVPEERGASAEVKPKPADARKKPTTTVRR
jgi:hypothetical protein